jgi:hypothetical protein
MDDADERGRVHRTSAATELVDPDERGRETSANGEGNGLAIWGFKAK